MFTVKNKTQYDITHVLDGKSFKQKPNESLIFTAYSGGIIKFDSDGRKDYVQNKSYNLSNGRTYEFQNNNSTPGNPYDIELYKVA